MKKLNIGCGTQLFSGWINMDLDAPDADVHHDMRTPLPFDEASVDFIFNEHVVEHLDLEESRFFFLEAHRVLKPGGILRIATPDLDHLVEKYGADWKNQPWITEHGYEALETNAEMLNLSMREWGHKFLFNAEDLCLRLNRTGFVHLKQETPGKSAHGALKDLETRSDSRLIIEAEKSTEALSPAHRLHLKTLEKRLKERVDAEDFRARALVQQIEDLSRIIKDRETRVAELQGHITNKDRHIGNLETAVSDKNRHMQGLEDAIGDKDRHISNLEAGIKSLEAGIKSLETWIQKTQKRLPLRLFNIKYRHLPDKKN